MNRVILSGRLTKDNELKISSSNGTAYLFNTLAVEEYSAKEKKKVTEFLLDIEQRRLKEDFQ
jgi:single-stranded DNA-binding protein